MSIGNTNTNSYTNCNSHSAPADTYTNADPVITNTYANCNNDTTSYGDTNNDTNSYTHTGDSLSTTPND